MQTHEMDARIMRIVCIGQIMLHALTEACVFSTARTFVQRLDQVSHNMRTQ